MTAAVPAYWLLEDLAATGDLASGYQVNNSTITNWVTRYKDFPPPLIELSTGPVYSRWQVRQWHERRWPDRQRAGDPMRDYTYRVR